MRATAIAAALALAAGAAGAQQAQEPLPATAINTGGRAGAYHSAFCPQIPPVLAAKDFQGYACTPSAGTIENIERVLANPAHVGFAQFDVLARRLAERPAEAAKLAVVRDDIACEALLMVTRNPTASFGDIAGRARRLRFVLPPERSGSAASFAFLQSLDPDGLGRAREGNVERAPSAMAVVERVANAPAEDSVVGFFVQFADPDNAVIKRIVEAKLTVVPVVSRAILRAAVGEKRVYEAQTFDLGGAAGTITTGCTKVALITGSPDAFATRDDRDDAADRIRVLAEAPRDRLLPRTGGLAAMLRAARRLGQSATDAAVAAVERARSAVVD